jgi:hypothetical protein
MNRSNSALTMLLKNTALTSAKKPTDRLKVSLPSNKFTTDQWIQSLPEHFKRTEADEAYRKEIAKRQF